jgi:hypothetical protein
LILLYRNEKEMVTVVWLYPESSGTALDAASHL